MDLASSPIVLEIAAEVCYKMGGIHTVIKTKAQRMQEIWGDRYCMIGPYLPIDYHGVFEEKNLDEFNEDLGKAVKKMRETGVDVHVGKWLIPGKPNVILLDPYEKIIGFENFKANYAAVFNIKFPLSKTIDMYLNFGAQLKILLELLSNTVPEKPIIAHFHEYNASYGLPAIKQANFLNVVTVFTTHATVIGRSMAYRRNDFYQLLPTVNYDQQIRIVREDVHTSTSAIMEKLIAENCDVLTAVSEITGEECKYLLGRAPDIITPNGFDGDHLNNYQVKRMHYKNSIATAVTRQLGEYAAVDANTLFFFTSGRFEYLNKGYDIFIKSLGKLNNELKKTKSNIKVIGIIVVDAPALGYSRIGLKLTKMYRKLKRNLLKRLGVIGGKIITHRSIEIPNYDPVLKDLRKSGLRNRHKDKVFVLYHPDFMTRSSPLFGMEYYDFVAGCDLGVFPSYYEPWGYTPAECTFLGVPAIASDTSGFAHYVSTITDHPKEAGINILKRKNNQKKKSIEELTALMIQCIKDRDKSGKITTDIKDSYQWKNFIRFYQKAYELALSKQLISH